MLSRANSQSYKLKIHLAWLVAPYLVAVSFFSFYETPLLELITRNKLGQNQDMRTLIVCQAYHLWSMQLVSKETLFELLQMVINHDHFNHPLCTSRMLRCLPR
jgi:hypothetical protein